jgi:hypothetical protein
MDKPTPQANDDELFAAFITLLNSSQASNEGNEEMAVMVYCEVSPLPDTLRE